MERIKAFFDYVFNEILFSWETFWWGIETFLSIGLIAAVVSGACLFLIHRRISENDDWYRVLGALMVVAFFGGLVGFHGGNSRVGVVGDLIPAVVTLLAGFAAYIFGLPDKKPGPYLFPLLGVFVVTLFISWSIGAANHSGNQQTNEWIARCMSVFGNSDVLGSDTAFNNANLVFGEYCDGALE